MEDHNEDSKNKRLAKYQRKHFAEDSDDQQNQLQNEESANKDSSKTRTLVGRWTNKEHDIFVECLKKYGKDWDKIELKIPFRTGTQIRSHAQKFFARIRKEFNTNNPMEYITRNMCDNSKVYKFETFKDVNEPQYPQQIELLSMDSMRNNKGDEEEKFPYSISAGKQQLQQIDQPQTNEFASLQQIRRQPPARSESIHKANKYLKLFKITKPDVNKKEDKEQKNNCENYPPLKKNVKYSKEASEGDSNISTKGSTSFICLSSGKIIIKGNEIETVVPCDIETVNNKVTMISPQQPVKICITPLSLSKPYVFDPKTQTFTSKKSSQSANNSGDSDNYFSNSGQSGNKSSSPVDKQMESMFSTMMLFNKYMRILDNNYCLGSINPNMCQSKLNIDTTRANSGNPDRQSNEPPLQTERPNNSFNSSSDNKINSSDQMQNDGNRPSSQPVSHNEHNKDWFNTITFNPYGKPVGNNCYYTPPLNTSAGWLNQMQKNFQTMVDAERLSGNIPSQHMFQG